MAKAAILVLAGTETHADGARVLNALEAAREFKDNGADEFELIFDGAATEWIPELEDESHDYHDIYSSLREDTSVCDFCAGAFGVDGVVNDAGIERLDDHSGHPSIRSLVDDEYEIVTF